MKYSKVYELRWSSYSLWHRCCLHLQKVQETPIVGRRSVLQGEAPIYQGTQYHIPEGGVRCFQCLICNHTFTEKPGLAVVQCSISSGNIHWRILELGNTAGCYTSNVNFRFRDVNVGAHVCYGAFTWHRVAHSARSCITHDRYFRTAACCPSAVSRS